MAEIGQKVAPAAMGPALCRALDRAQLLPDCLIAARRIANIVSAGWHGRRQKGIGENFWQFRPFVSGDSIADIDWRRSARDDHSYIREREWEAAHTVWLWADFSPSMLYQSSLGLVAKESRALVVMLAMAELVARSGERIGCAGVMAPIAARNAAERLAAALLHAKPGSDLADTARIKGPSDIVLIGDFLDPVEDTIARIAPLARRGIIGHVVEISDPAEELFPYQGRTEFIDPESGHRLTAGRAETLRDDYRHAYLARREVLARELGHLGWNFMTHRTDRPASEALVALHILLSGSGRRKPLERQRKRGEPL